MNRIFISIVLVFVVVGGLAVFQATRETASLVVLPSDIRTNERTHTNIPIRVAGRVADQAIESTINPELTLRFAIVNPGGKDGLAHQPSVAIPVLYRGLKPDMLRPGRDVIIDGTYHDGVLFADQLMTQCPSKYEPSLPKNSVASTK